MRRLALGAALGLISALALAQVTPILNLLGSETVVITLGSGSSIPVPIDQLRNTQSVSAVGAQTTARSSPSGAVGYLIATGAITSWDVTLPNPAYAGQKFYVANGHTSALTDVKISASTGTQTQTMATSFSNKTIQPASPVGYIYNYSASRWVRIQ